MPDDKLTIEYIPLDTAAMWDDNLKRHDIPKLIQSFKRHGFKDPPKFEPQLNGGQGGIVEGNGRFIALDAMRTQGDDPPRGIYSVDENWLVPVLFGVDADSEKAAEACGVDHNQLTMAGGDFDTLDYLNMWEPGFAEQVLALDDADVAPIAFDAEALEEIDKIVRSATEEALEEITETLKPIRWARVLVSVPVDRAHLVKEKLDALTDVEGIDVIYGAN